MSSSVACIIYKDGLILIAHRNPCGDMGNRWEFPGGKIDPGENAEMAIVREMKEEFGVKAVPGEKIGETFFLHKEKRCDVTAYIVNLEHDGIEKKFVLTEHSEYKWVLPSSIPSLDFVDSDLSLYPKVMKYLETHYEK